jgi:hypothetical protein
MKNQAFFLNINIILKKSPGLIAYPDSFTLLIVVGDTLGEAAEACAKFFGTVIIIKILPKQGDF